MNNSPRGSLEPGEPGPYLVLSQTQGLCSTPGPHLDLVNVVPIWASPSPGDFVPHLDMISVDSLLAPPGFVTLILFARHPDLVTLVLTCVPL